MALNQFTDYETKIKGRWFEPELTAMVKWGRVRGFPDGTLRPDRWGLDSSGDFIFAQYCVMEFRAEMDHPDIRLIRDKMVSVVYVTSGGSGFWFDTSADDYWYAVTNAHVVFADTEGTQRDFGVVGNPGLGFAPAQIQTQPASVEEVWHERDLAMLRVQVPGYEVERPPAIKEFADIAVGQRMWALGHPFRYLWDAADGRVRSRERIINVWQRPQHVYATTIGINPGNSGCLVTNRLGHAVGVAQAGITSANNYTFIIPILKLEEVA